MYKVFINSSSLVFRSRPVEDSIVFNDATQLKDIFLQLEGADTSEHLEVYSEDLEDLWNTWQSLFRVIEAAGGVVRNSNDEVLMIYRLEKWDLPKGKLEKNEAVEEAAVREVMEECGVPEPRLVRRLKDTYHTYRIKEEPVLKRTYWYEMSFEYVPKPTPQLEEDITRVMWCDHTTMSDNLKNTYGNIKDILEEFLIPGSN